MREGRAPFPEAREVAGSAAVVVVWGHTEKSPQTRVLKCGSTTAEYYRGGLETATSSRDGGI
jgi:hypothetical protein